MGQGANNTPRTSESALKTEIQCKYEDGRILQPLHRALCLRIPLIVSLWSSEPSVIFSTVKARVLHIGRWTLLNIVIQVLSGMTIPKSCSDLYLMVARDKDFWAESNRLDIIPLNDWTGVNRESWEARGVFTDEIRHREKCAR